MENRHPHWFTADEVRWMFRQEPESLELREQVFSVPGPREGERLYPAYQFDPDTGRPWPVGIEDPERAGGIRPRTS